MCYVLELLISDFHEEQDIERLGIESHVFY